MAPVGGIALLRITGVITVAVRLLMPAFRAALPVKPAMRSRGLMNSSRPKLRRASPVPSAATQTPGGAHHHHQPPLTAVFAEPPRSISPHLHSPGRGDCG